ncbi:DUF1062 domain-containing protein [Aquamicrobium sp. LC103]|uniref:DUF1062 domain-containing protein n=1 Tax=Aquamicrobium sp. LC103 TaxID=1120658 RepID=UPI00063E95B0|nr:DUF1062 domain-containing protein [Aquamicrobium sp. LC103]TKT82955.1 DUF1062 domain-containing protein [Aquamicrobium sp. LC103]
MSRSVRWTIVPRTAPQPWISCSRCDCERPFRSSGKFRVNANGKRIDAWLIYKCSHCDDTWNFPIFERRNRHELEAAAFEALTSNDPELARHFAWDVAGLRSRASRVEEATEFLICKEVQSRGQENARRLELEIVSALPVSTRLDRLLAGGLGLSRSRLLRLHEEGRVAITPGGAAVLRRPVRNGTRVVFDLRELPEACDIARRAAGDGNEN